MQDALLEIAPDGVALLTFNRPDRKNAVNSGMMTALEQHLSHLERRADLLGLLVTGAGDAFVSGGDLKELHGLTSHEESLAMNRRMRAILRRLEMLECPVFVAINGTAVGGGCEVALAGDRRLCARDATLHFRQATLGLTPGWGGLTRLERLVGRSRAFDVLLIGSSLTAEQALRLGLVDEVLPGPELVSHGLAQLRTLAALPPLALRSVKRGLLRVGEMPFDQAQDYEAELFARTWSSDDHWEAVDAFFHKRKPVFRGH